MKSFIFTLLFGAFACGCVSATVVEPRLCDVKSVVFPGASMNSAYPFMATQSFTLNLGVGNDVITNVKLLEGQLTRADGGDFAFLDEIMIAVSDPNGGNDLVIWDSQHNSGTSLSVTASDKNLANYIDSNNMFTVNVTIASQNPPAFDWELDANLCVSAEVTKTFP